MRPQQRFLGTLASFGSRTFDGTKYVLPSPFTLQGNNGAWVTIPVDQYYVAYFAGYVSKRSVDNSLAIVDWSSYTGGFRATYTVTVSGVRTTYTNEAITFADEVNASGEPVFFEPLGVDGQLIAANVLDLVAQIILAGGGNIIMDSTGFGVGNPPPTGPSTGTGIWIDATGIYGLNANNLIFKLSSTQGTTLTQVFTTPGTNTWTKPTGAKSVRVVLIGGGGGGAAGAKGLAANGPTGGPGGGGAGITDYSFSADNLGATETVFVGAGGTGGAAQTANGTPGNNGAAGQPTYFGDWIQATGAGGTAGKSTTGGDAGNGLTSGGGAGAGYTAGGAGQTATPSGLYGASGGGGGGSIDSVPTAYNGGVGGANPGLYKGTLAGGARGTVGAGQNAGNGNSAGANMPVPGTGGGGGASSITGNAGTGGNGGAYGAGGGGGGAALNNTGNSGKGGDGAPGIAIVITLF